MDIRCKSDNKLGKNLDQRGEEFNTSEKIQKYAEKIYKTKSSGICTLLNNQIRDGFLVLH